MGNGNRTRVTEKQAMFYEQVKGLCCLLIGLVVALSTILAQESLAEEIAPTQTHEQVPAASKENSTKEPEKETKSSPSTIKAKLLQYKRLDDVWQDPIVLASLKRVMGADYEKLLDNELSSTYTEKHGDFLIQSLGSVGGGETVILCLSLKDASCYICFTPTTGSFEVYGAKNWNAIPMPMQEEIEAYGSPKIVYKKAPPAVAEPPGPSKKSEKSP